MEGRNLYQTTFFNLGVLILRLGLGIYLLRASFSYLFEGKMEELTGFLTSLEWPMPELFAQLSQWVEFISAILILLGFRFGAFTMAFTLAIAVIFAHGGRILEDGMLPFTLSLSSFALGFLGCGKFSLDFYMLKTNSKS
ncbi:putative oxidoreductase [Algoriphagus boseongensis]|uniref:Putative oxidoreductase n=1 Tax=Algoriphagus boseongensis TaxID=1442587 RepID=A0A4R6TBK5_9BACT|nr:DoxX family protein [Algoriphagus boseongensis]TDQ19055.1 putative oxidoreductase [Algoriphagus boseongensis]